MNIDLTYKISKDSVPANIMERIKGLFEMGHLGTHFDVMDKQFPLEYFERKGKIVDVSHIRDREITIEDLQQEIAENDFVIFKTGFIKEAGYGTEKYFKGNSPELSDELIDFLLEKKISIIGIDASGIKKGAKHPQADQHCADHQVFVIENLDHLDVLLANTAGNPFTVYCLPLSIEELSGLPCRVVAKI